MPVQKKLKLLREREAEYQDKVRQQVTAWFDQFDENGDGQLQREELRALLTHLNPERPPSDDNLDFLIEKATEVNTFSLQMKGNKNGAVSWHDTRATVARYADYCKDEAYLDAIFKEFDTDGNGELDSNELHPFLSRIAPEGCIVEEADLRYVFEACDPNGDGVIVRTARLSGSWAHATASACTCL